MRGAQNAPAALAGEANVKWTKNWLLSGGAGWLPLFSPGCFVLVDHGKTKCGNLAEGDIVDNRIKLRIFRGNLVLFAALFGLVTLNKKLLRPQLNYSNIGQVVAGCLPNFLAGFFISMFVVNPVLIKKPKHGRRLVYIFSFLVFAILSLEEFMPLWGASTQFDWFDVWASGLGCCIAVVSYEIIERRGRAR